jgi:hypothetical protein
MSRFHDWFTVLKYIAQSYVRKKEKGEEMADLLRYSRTRLDLSHGGNTNRIYASRYGLLRNRLMHYM